MMQVSLLDIRLSFCYCNTLRFCSQVWLGDKFLWQLILNNQTLESFQICIGGEGLQDTCQGDSGSPVIKLGASSQYYLLGVTSYGSKHCGRENYPAVYTSVLHYVQWIKDTMEKHYTRRRYRGWSVH